MKLLRKSLSLLLSICMILNIFIVLPAVTADAAGSHHVFIDTDMFDHGTVTPVNFTNEAMYKEGYRILMNATPDDGYKLTGWTVTAFQSGRQIDVEIYERYYSFVIPEFPSQQRRQYIQIIAHFEEKDPDEPDGPYHVNVYCPDHDNTGSSIRIDHDDGNYNAGDLVTVSIDWTPGTRFFYGGLSNSDYTDPNGDTHIIEFTKVNESTYTFIMPALCLGTSVRLSCFFEFIPYHVTYETDFGSAQISDEEKARYPSKKPQIYLYNIGTDHWDGKDWPLETHRGQDFRVETYNNNDLYGCTGITAVYQENGETVEKDIVSDSGYGFDPSRSVYGKMTMPASDVKLKLKMQKLLFVNTVSTDQGRITASLYRTLPGDEVQIRVTPADNYACTGIKVTDANGHDVPLSADKRFIMPDTDVTVTASYYLGYLDRQWDGEKVVEEFKPIPDDKMIDINSVTNNTLENGKWYVVSSNKTFNSRLKVNGSVNIVLCDGAALTVNDGIRVNNGDSLHIYGQQRDTGKLSAVCRRTVDASGRNNAAIGADSGNAGNIEIHGGIVKSESALACEGAAIGGGGGGAAGVVKIYGGSVDAYSATNGAAIGGGRNGQASHVNGEGIVVYGGKVVARSDAAAAAIGGGYKSNGSTGSIAVYGGQINATGRNGAAAIGGGQQGSNGQIDIHDGVITAIAYDSIVTGAAIGSGGEANQNGSINIHGGSIVAQSTYGAGIGAGSKGSAGTINISDGNVIASSSCGGAGIGGGKDGSGGSIKISGGETVASSQRFNNAGEYTDFFLNYIGEMDDPEFEEVGGAAIIAGITAIIEYLILDTEYSGAGIGGGHGGAGGTIDVSGGIVTAICGLDSANAIGRGKNSGSTGSLTIYNTAKVKAGANENNALSQLSANRVPACRNHKYAHIEPCDHYDDNHVHQLEYIDAGFDGHRQRCAFCNIEQEGVFPHDYRKNGECVKCHHKSKITIQKVWANDQQRPGEVTVNITSVWKAGVNSYETDDLVVTLDEENGWRAEVPAVYGRHKLSFTEELTPGYVPESWKFSSPDLPDNEIILPRDNNIGEGSAVLDLINENGSVDAADYAAYLSIMRRENGVVKLKNKPAKTITFKKMWPDGEDFDENTEPDEITLRYTSGLDSGVKTIRKNENWTVSAQNIPFNGRITVTEEEPDDFAAAGWIIEGGGERVMIPMKHGDMSTVVIPPPNYDELNVTQETRDRISRALAANDTAVTVVNTKKKTYSVEKKWEIDFADKDRPDEISVVLQRRDNWHTWTSIELLTLNAANNWSGEFDPVAESVLDEDPDFHTIALEPYKYRIRELGPKKNANDPDPDPQDDNFQAKVKERLVYDKWDFDKDLLKTLIEKATNPDTYWKWEPNKDWVIGLATSVLIPPPNVKFEIEGYNDGVKDIAKHTTKYISPMSMTAVRTRVRSLTQRRWISASTNAGSTSTTARCPSTST